MKRQRRFDWFRCVTISVFVIGIGLVLFSIFSWIAFDTEDLYTNEFVSNSDFSTASQTFYAQPANQFSYSFEETVASQAEPSVMEDTTSDEQFVGDDDLLSWLTDSELASELESTELLDENEQKTEQQLQALASNVRQIAGTYENILQRRKALASGARPEDFGITGSQEYEEYKNTKWDLQVALSDYLHAIGPNALESNGWIYEELQGMAEFWFDGENELHISVTDRMLKEP